MARADSSSLIPDHGSHGARWARSRSMDAMNSAAFHGSRDRSSAPSPSEYESIRSSMCAEFVLPILSWPTPPPPARPTTPRSLRLFTQYDQFVPWFVIVWTTVAHEKLHRPRDKADPAGE